MLEIITAAVAAATACVAGSVLIVLRRRRRGGGPTSDTEDTAWAGPGQQVEDGHVPNSYSGDDPGAAAETDTHGVSDPFGGEPDQQEIVDEGTFEEEIGEVEDDELAERWEAALLDDEAVLSEPLQWEAVGPAPIPLFETIATETPFSVVPQGVASLLEPEGLEERPDAPVEFHVDPPQPPRPGRFSRLFARRRSSSPEPVLITEDRAFQTESNESRSKSAYEAPIVELDQEAVEAARVVVMPEEAGPETVDSEHDTGEHVLREMAEESVGAGESATLPEPDSGQEIDFRDVSVLELATSVETLPVPQRRSRFRRRRQAEIEKLEVGQWESWNAPDAFGGVEEAGIPVEETIDGPENAILASAMPELPLSFELDELPEDFETEISFLGPSFELPHTIEDGAVIVAPASNGASRGGGSRGRGLLERLAPRRGTKAAPAPEEESAAPASWFDASVRGGPAPALTPGDIVDYTRYDLPEAIPDRVAVVVSDGREEPTEL